MNKTQENELLKQILKICAESPDATVRHAIASNGYFLEEFENDPNPFVREALVNNNYKVEDYIYDDDWRVRAAVARKGVAKSILAYDKNWKVRVEVAKQKKLSTYDTMALAHDSRPEVRAALASTGHRLHVLSNDKSPMVKKAVIDTGYKLGIRKFVKDKDPNIREYAKFYALTHDDAKAEWVYRKRYKMCNCCEYIIDRYHIPSTRCPQCNFTMVNYKEFMEEYYGKKDT